MSETWAPDDRGQLATIARNLATRYVVIATEMVLGLVILPACLIPMRGISSGTLLAVL